MWMAIALISAVIVYVIVTYNSLVALKNRGVNAFADIDVQLKRRHDLVPNLVATVQGYASHENSVFEDVARLRNQAMGAQSTDERSGAESQFAGAIKSLFAVAESYPELKADQNFRDLQSQLTEVEDHIQYSRRYYNAVVRDLNTKRELFPSSLIASIFAIQPMRYFQAADEDRESVQVRFDKEGQDGG